VDIGVPVIELQPMRPKTRNSLRVMPRLRLAGGLDPQKSLLFRVLSFWIIRGVTNGRRDCLRGRCGCREALYGFWLPPFGGRVVNRGGPFWYAITPLIPRFIEA